MSLAQVGIQSRDLPPRSLVAVPITLFWPLFVILWQEKLDSSDRTVFIG